MKKAQLHPLSKAEVLDLVKVVLSDNLDKSAEKTIKEGFKRLGAADPIDENSRMSYLIQKLSSVQMKKN